ncbi:MAG: hypothetical protein Q7S20_01250 [Gemmatimonadaceae bacterium]|nr:hypothetical protein [Gemmatimonadaceae bacterium]
MKIHRMLLVGVIALAACSSEKVTEPKLTVAGNWSGTFTPGASSVSLSLLLTENAGQVTGNGTISGETSTALTVTGTFVAPNVSLTLSPPGFEPMNYAAFVKEASMSGALNGSGFFNQGVTLSRH